MSAKFASLHSGLLARKGQATPAMVPLPVVPERGSFSYTDAPAPARDETCCRAVESQPAGAHADSGAGLHRPMEVHHDVGVDHRTHVSVRLSPEQLRRLKTAAAQLHVSQQKLMADGLEFILDKLAGEDLAGCRCLRAKA
jgi:hypothetical protein